MRRPRKEDEGARNCILHVPSWQHSWSERMQVSMSNFLSKTMLTWTTTPPGLQHYLHAICHLWRSMTRVKILMTISRIIKLPWSSLEAWALYCGHLLHRWRRQQTNGTTCPISPLMHFATARRERRAQPSTIHHSNEGESLRNFIQWFNNERSGLEKSLIE